VKAIIQKVDLDTCLTALILGVDLSVDEVIVVKGEAGEEDIERFGGCLHRGGRQRSVGPQQLRSS